MLALLPKVAWACFCFTPSICAAYESSDVVFTGTVESIEPDYPDVFLIGRLFRAVTADEVPNPVAFSELKHIYTSAVPEPLKSRIASAVTYADLRDALEMLPTGRDVRFKVQRVFKGSQRDSITVSTDVTSCGFHLQKGESYVVYASVSEGDRKFTTGACRRNARVSDAGSDLVDLYFLHNVGQSAVRVLRLVDRCTQ